MNSTLTRPGTELRAIALKYQNGERLTDKEYKRLASRMSVEDSYSRGPSLFGRKMDGSIYDTLGDESPKSVLARAVQKASTEGRLEGTYGAPPIFGQKLNRQSAMMDYKQRAFEDAHRQEKYEMMRESHAANMANRSAALNNSELDFAYRSWLWKKQQEDEIAKQEAAKAAQEQANAINQYAINNTDANSAYGKFVRSNVATMPKAYDTLKNYGLFDNSPKIGEIVELSDGTKMVYNTEKSIVPISTNRNRDNFLDKYLLPGGNVYDPNSGAVITPTKVEGFGITEQPVKVPNPEYLDFLRRQARKEYGYTGPDDGQNVVASKKKKSPQEAALNVFGE